MSTDSILSTDSSIADTVTQVVSTVSHAVAEVAHAPAGVAAGSVFPDHPGFWELLEFQVTGLVIVMSVLATLSLATYGMAWLIKTFLPEQYAPKPKAAPAIKAPVAAAATSATDGPVHPGLTQEQLIVILSAAAAEVIGKPISVVKFRSMNAMDWTWAVQGRVELHTSHRLR